QVGVSAPDMRPVNGLEAGQVGYLTASIKRVADAKMGETITDAARPTATPCPGYRDAKPMVFAGLYPIEDTDYEGLRDALEKLRLNVRVQLRAGDVPRPRLRLPLRLPRHAPPRDRAGTARARVQPLADRHRAQRPVQGRDAAGRDPRGGESLQAAARGQDRPHRGALRPR